MKIDILQSLRDFAISEAEKVPKLNTKGLEYDIASTRAILAKQAYGEALMEFVKGENETTISIT